MTAATSALERAWADVVSGGEAPDAVAGAARVADAFGELRFHPALRRRAPEVHAEVLVRAASASAAVDGARVPPAVLRRAHPGDADPADPDPADPAERVGLGALRAMLAVDRAGAALLRSPGQVLARAHAAAAAGVVGADALGRPRPGAEPSVRAVTAALGAGSGVSAVTVSALVHAELAAADVLPPVSGVVGRAMARGVLRARGVDPLGVGLPEAVCGADAGGYRQALAGYLQGGHGAVAWVAWWADALVAGAAAGRAAADAVLAGRPD